MHLWETNWNSSSHCFWWLKDCLQYIKKKIKKNKKKIKKNKKKAGEGDLVFGHGITS